MAKAKYSASDRVLAGRTLKRLLHPANPEIKNAVCDTLLADYDSLPLFFQRQNDAIVHALRCPLEDLPTLIGDIQVLVRVIAKARLKRGE